MLNMSFLLFLSSWFNSLRMALIASQRTNIGWHALISFISLLTYTVQVVLKHQEKKFDEGEAAQMIRRFISGKFADVRLWYTTSKHTQFCPSPPRWVNQPCRWWTWRNWSRSGTDSFKHAEPGKAGAAKLPSKFECANVEILSCTSATLVKTVYWKLLGDFGNESPGVKKCCMRLQLWRVCLLGEDRTPFFN